MSRLPMGPWPRHWNGAAAATAGHAAAVSWHGWREPALSPIPGYRRSWSCLVPWSPIDESDPLLMGADGHSNNLLNTGELHWQAAAAALLWLKGTERSLSPVLFCLDSEYAANAIQGTSQVHQSDSERCANRKGPAGSCISKKLDAGRGGQVGSPSLTFKSSKPL